LFELKNPKSVWQNKNLFRTCDGEKSGKISAEMYIAGLRMEQLSAGIKE
jgi:hypothetical protein